MPAINSEWILRYKTDIITNTHLSLKCVPSFPHTFLTVLYRQIDQDSFIAHHF